MYNAYVYEVTRLETWLMLLSFYVASMFLTTLMRLGGSGDNGEVTDVTSWQKKLPGSAVNVTWRRTKKSGTYRRGAEGCVDVVYEEEASGGSVYHEHLPLVGAKTVLIAHFCSDFI